MQPFHTVTVSLVLESSATVSNQVKIRVIQFKMGICA